MLPSDDHITVKEPPPARIPRRNPSFPYFLITSSRTIPAYALRTTLENGTATTVRPRHRLTKRAFDLTICLLILPFVVILTVIIAYLIWLEDGGSPLFCQMRTGQYGRRFSMVKFRTMVRNAEKMKRQLMHLNELQPPDFKISNDPRITRVGRFLRRSSLDELPQIYNILKGDMSLVGPRPTSFAATTYEPWQWRRLEVVPGLTGLWQVSGRSELEFSERVALDIEYIDNQTFWLDLLILWRTIGSVFNGRGAY